MSAAAETHRQTCFAPLRLDAPAETERIVAFIRRTVRGLRRKGVVLGLSGGVDSTVTAALCARALGPERVLGLLMPEHDSSPAALRLGREAAEWLGVPWLVEDVGPVLAAAGCYRRREEALRAVWPDYQPDWKFKIVLPSLFGDAHYRLFFVVAQPPGGQLRRRRLPLEAYQQLVAATNFKQRVRKMMEYYHADRLRLAVAGTPNLLEYELGFFVKNGDGAADVKPIAHLYKSQVYQLADYLDVPLSIRSRPPTTDTYSLEQTQEEFFFALPLPQLDACLYGKRHGLPPADVAAAAGLTADQVARVYLDLDAKRRAAAYLHAPPAVLESP